MCGKTSFVFRLLIAIVIFSSASKGGSYIHAMGDEECDIIKDFFTGNFNVPVASRTRLQKSTYVNFWRLRKRLSIDLQDNLPHEKNKIVKNGDVKRIVTKTFIKNKSGGCRKIRARAAYNYSELSRRNVLKVTENDLKLRRFNAQFTNKAVHKPICAWKVLYRNKVLRRLILADFAKFSEVREKLFCEKSRILFNRENKLLQKIFIFFI